MKSEDIDALAREAGLICSHDINNKIVSCDVRRDGLQRFASLVLEKAAQNHDEAAAEWGRIARGCTDGLCDCKQIAAEQLADDLRQMAQGLTRCPRTGELFGEKHE